MTVLLLNFTTLLSLNTLAQCTHNGLLHRIDTYSESSAANDFSVVVLKSKKNQIIISKGYACADRKNKITNSPSTVFNIGQ